MNAVCRSVAEAADTAYAYTFLATKCVPEVLTTPKLLEPLLVSQFEQPTYVLLQNGLGIEKDLYEHGVNVLKKPLNIVNTAIYLFASQEGPNTVAVDDTVRLLILPIVRVLVTSLHRREWISAFIDTTTTPRL